MMNKRLNAAATLEQFATSARNCSVAFKATEYERTAIVDGLIASAELRAV